MTLAIAIFAAVAGTVFAFAVVRRERRLYVRQRRATTLEIVPVRDPDDWFDTRATRDARKRHVSRATGSPLTIRVSEHPPGVARDDTSAGRGVTSPADEQAETS